MSALPEWIESTAAGGCAELLQRFVAPIAALDAEQSADYGAFGARFRMPAGTLCEVTVFGELFIVRIGGDQSIEYRVRNDEVAVLALDAVLQRYVWLREGAAIAEVQVAP